MFKQPVLATDHEEIEESNIIHTNNIADDCLLIDEIGSSFDSISDNNESYMDIK